MSQANRGLAGPFLDSGLCGLQIDSGGCGIGRNSSPIRAVVGGAPPLNCNRGQAKWSGGHFVEPDVVQ